MQWLEALRFSTAREKSGPVYDPQKSGPWYEASMLTHDCSNCFPLMLSGPWIIRLPLGKVVLHCRLSLKGTNVLESGRGHAKCSDELLQLSRNP